MPQQTSQQELLQALEQIVRELRDQLHEVLRLQAERGEIESGLRGGSQHQGSAKSALVAIELRERIDQLEQIQQLIAESPEAMRLIDSVIHKRVKTSEKRQQTISFLSNIAFLFAGWLLSLVGTPANFLHLFG